MKKTILVLLVILYSSFSLVNAQTPPAQKTKTQSKTSEVTLACKLDCNACCEKVKKQLAFTKGVKDVSADHEKDIIVVKYRSDKTNVDKLISSLAEIGFTAQEQKPCPAKTSCPGQKSKCPSQCPHAKQQ